MSITRYIRFRSMDFQIAAMIFLLSVFVIILPQACSSVPSNSVQLGHALDRQIDGANSDLSCADAKRLLSRQIELVNAVHSNPDMLTRENEHKMQVAAEALTNAIIRVVFRDAGCFDDFDN